MIANTAIFTCSICGEASTEICAYCTKDTCPNHLCERCKRCSDCCECELPLSANEPLLSGPFAEASAPHSPVVEAESTIADFLTPAESSVFAAEPDPAESHVFTGSSVFVESDEPAEQALESQSEPESEP